MTEAAFATRHRVLLVDDHELAREAVHSVLSNTSDFEVIGEAEDGMRAIALAHQLHPDLVILDVRMPHADGLAALRALVSAFPDIRVVILSSYGHFAYVRDALLAGAAGYLLKGATKQELLATLRRALAADGVNVAPEILARVLESARAGVIGSNLSQREIEVLRLIARGLSNEQIAQKLNLSVNTIKTHVAHLLQKLHAADRVAAVARGAELDLLDEPGRRQSP